MKYDKALIINFGSQNNFLVPRKIRKLGIFCEVKNYRISKDDVLKINPKAIILTVEKNTFADRFKQFDKNILNLNIPVLIVGNPFDILSGKESDSINNIDIIKYDDVILFVCEDISSDKLKYFLIEVVKCSTGWTMQSYAESTISALKEKLYNKKVLLALSGGVDSSVTAALLSKAIGSNLTCIFVDHGLMRKNEGDDVEKTFSNMDLNFIRVDAEDRFLSKLKDVTDPEAKRKIIGKEFIRVFEAEAKKIGSVDFLAQGTIYPDIIESGTLDSELIKSHHNVGGLPKHVDFKELIEPLSLLFKDEVRELGKVLELSDSFINRQPFPGPGLAVRVIGNLTKEKLDILRDADFIFRQALDNANLQDMPSQYFAVLTDIKSVGIKNSKRTYDYTLALRAVTTTDFMTVKFSKIPYDILENVSQKITDEVKGINRVVFDITNKPPASVEWE